MLLSGIQILGELICGDVVLAAHEAQKAVHHIEHMDGNGLLELSSWKIFGVVQEELLPELLQILYRFREIPGIDIRVIEAVCWHLA